MMRLDERTFRMGSQHGGPGAEAAVPDLPSFAGRGCVLRELCGVQGLQAPSLTRNRALQARKLAAFERFVDALVDLADRAPELPPERTTSLTSTALMAATSPV